MYKRQVTETTDKYDVLVNVYGGGTTGQAGAIRHGIARALIAVSYTHLEAICSRMYCRRPVRANR